MSEVLVRLKKIAATNSLKLSFGQESKSSYSNGSFLLLKKCVIVCALPETEDHINSFQINFPSL